MTRLRWHAAIAATALVTSGLSGAGSVAAYLPAASAATASDLNSAPGTYRPVTATRVLDTRSGLGAPKHQVAARATLELTLAGHAGVPTTGASAVVVNLTETRATHSGYLTTYPARLTRPTASNVNFPAGTSVANLVTVRLGTGGAVDIYNGTSGALDLIVDVRGYYLSGSAVDPGAFTPLAPTRLLDTRIGTGAPKKPVAGHAGLTLQVAGKGGIPASGVSSVVLNLTATAEQGSGYLTVYGDGTRPVTSNVNFSADRTVANLVTVPLSSTGAITIYNGSAGSTHLIADIAGYTRGGTAAASGAYVPVAPSRLLDTRCVPGGTCENFRPGRYPGTWPAVNVTGLAGVPETDVAAVVVNLTATQVSESGYLSLTTTGTVAPTTSDVNFTAGRTTAAQVIAPLGPAGELHLYFGATHQGTANAIIDVVGYIRAPSLTWSAPILPDPQHGPSRYLSCPTTTSCVGLDPYANARTFDGATWSLPTPVPGMLRPSGIACPSVHLCLAVGAGASGSVAASYDGTSWTADGSFAGGFAVISISCPTTTFCLALDSHAGIYTNTGGGWSARTVVAIAGSSTRALSCASATFCAFGDGAAGFFVYNGTSWAAGPNSSVLINSLDCVSPTFCAMATAGQILGTYDGSSWATVSEPSNTRFTALSCPTASRCVAVTLQGQAATWDGSAWSALATAEPTSAAFAGFWSLSCASATSCVAADEGGHSLTLDGSTWSTPVLTQPFNGLSSISCPTTAFCLATDADGAALTFGAGSWSTPTTVLTGHARTHASCASATSCFVVDESGHATSYDGVHWSAPTDPDPGRALTAVSCPAAGQCVAIDAAGNALTYNGSWSAPLTASGTGPVALSCPAVGTCLTVDGQGHAFGLSGGTWTARGSLGSAIKALSCVSATHCVALGAAGASTYDGTAWSPFVDAATSDLAVSCPSTTFCLAAGAQFLSFYGQATWTQSLAPFYPGSNGAEPASVSCVSDRFCVTVNEGNLISIGTA